MSTLIEANAAAATQETAMPAKERTPNTFEGKFLRLTGDALVMTSLKGKEYTHTLARDAQFTCDGEVCQAQDLKAGREIRVTTRPNDRNVVHRVECLDQQAEFAQGVN